MFHVYLKWICILPVLSSVSFTTDFLYSFHINYHCRIWYYRLISLLGLFSVPPISPFPTLQLECILREGRSLTVLFTPVFPVPEWLNKWVNEFMNFSQNIKKMYILEVMYRLDHRAQMNTLKLFLFG